MYNKHFQEIENSLWVQMKMKDRQTIKLRKVVFFANPPLTRGCLALGQSNPSLVLNFHSEHLAYYSMIYCEYGIFSFLQVVIALLYLIENSFLP